MRRSLFLNLLKYGLAFGLLGYIIWLNWLPESEHGLAAVWQRHAVQGEPIALGYLALAFVLFTFSYVLTFVRWYFLVRAQGLPFHMKDAIRLGFYGTFFSTFLPGSVGGDAVKAVGIARSQKKRTIAVATVLMDRIIAVWAMVIMVAAMGGVYVVMGLLDNASVGAKQVVRGSGLIIVISFIVWIGMGWLPQRRADRFAAWLGKIPKVGHALSEVWRAVWIYRCKERSVYLALLLTWIGQVGLVMGFYFSVLSLYNPAAGGIPSITDHFLLVPLGLIIQAVPLFPGGAGIGEAGFGGLYAWFGSAAAIAVVGSLVMRALTWIFAVLGFLIAQRLHPVPATTTEAEPAPAPMQPFLKPACETSPV